MSDVVIRVENLGKKYRLTHQRRERYTALRDVFGERIRGFFRKQYLTNEANPSVEDFWALKNVSFDIKQGEVVGIIGRNGAGKSTLLKVLSRITEPTVGCVRVKGRIASLLEVGTGFHPELTGRENIYLNGAILGMSRIEIKSRFDEIVAFAEIEKFLDTPVKRYSSGMYVRLAFAVAAHLEPEILVIDEVLAVGDAEFQKKCLGRIEDLTYQQGRTVLFVSHNMSTIQSLCSRGILLSEGQVKLDDAARVCVQDYLKRSTELMIFERDIAQANKVKIFSGSVQHDNRNIDHKAIVKLGIWSDTKRRVSLDLRLADGIGHSIGFGSLGTFSSKQMIDLDYGVTLVTISFLTNDLANGAYVISLDLTVPFQEYLDRVEYCLGFEYERPGQQGQTHVMSQQWGYGSWRIPLMLESVEEGSLRESINVSTS